MSDAVRRTLLRLVALIALIAGGCGGDDAARPSPSASPPPRSAFSGLVVLHADVPAAAGETLGAPPADWPGWRPDPAFDRALAHADWKLDDLPEIRGTTTADGRFEIGALPPGRHTLTVSRTLGGRLLSLTIPVVVGDDGGGSVAAEIGPHGHRTTLTYTTGGIEHREVHGPSGRLVVAGGRITEIQVGGRSLRDHDRDGRFDAAACAWQAWLCGRPFDPAPGGTWAWTCLSSCPDCADCLAQVCTDQPVPRPPYRCGDDETCTGADQCVCVGSCPYCDDCAIRACLPPCGPVEITGIRIVNAPDRLMAGEYRQAEARFVFSDDTSVPALDLVTWTSSHPAVATVGPWGEIGAVAEGKTALLASAGQFTSDPWHLEVVPRPPPVRLWIEPRVCDGRKPGPEPALPPAPDGGPCPKAMLPGSERVLAAVAEFEGGLLQDVTAEAGWEVEPAGIGTVNAGTFTARAVGTAHVSAVLGNLRSEPAEIRVVAAPLVVALRIVPGVCVLPPMEGPAAVPGTVPPPDPACWPWPVSCDAPQCPASPALLVGDRMQLLAMAVHDTGEWADVTDEVTWTCAPPAVATVDAAGVVTALGAGEATVGAHLGTIEAPPLALRVVDPASVTALLVFPDASDHVLAPGDALHLRAFAVLDGDLLRDVTGTAGWHTSEPGVARFVAPGEAVAAAPGVARVWAELGETRSAPVRVEVVEPVVLESCDPHRIHQAAGTDELHTVRLALASDCATYRPPGVALFRYTVSARPLPPEWPRLLGPCVALDVFRGPERIRTLRDGTCDGPSPPPPAAEGSWSPGRAEGLVAWDLKDQLGVTVPPGRYTVRGRLGTPHGTTVVVNLDVLVVDPNGRVPCEVTTCGNGCGYVRACGDSGPPPACPEVCREVCECPPGWGWTADGTCEPCLRECCPHGAPCVAGMRPCDLPCCPADGDRCLPGLPPCPPPPVCGDAGTGCDPDGSCPSGCCAPGLPCPAVRVGGARDP